MKKWLTFSKGPKLGPNFEKSLHDLLERDMKADPKVKVPIILTNLLKQLEKETSLKSEGILRLSGQVKVIKQVRDLLDRDAETDLSSYDPYVLGDILKQFLRSIPEGLIPAANLNAFLVASDSVDALMDAVDGLDDVNYYCLKEVIGLCTRIANFKDDNKMSFPNLTLLVTPNIFKANGMADNMRMSNSVHALMIHFDKIFDDVHHDEEIKIEEAKVEEANVKETKVEIKPIAIETNQAAQYEPQLPSPTQSMGGVMQSVLDELSGSLSTTDTPAAALRPLTPKEILTVVKRKSIDSQAQQEAKAVVQEVVVVPQKTQETVEPPQTIPEKKATRARSDAKPEMPDSSIQPVESNDQPAKLHSKTKDRPPPPRKLTIQAKEAHLQADEPPEKTQTQEVASPRSILKSPFGSAVLAPSPTKNVRFDLNADVQSYTVTTESSVGDSDEEDGSGSDFSNESEEHWYEGNTAVIDDGETVVHEDAPDVQPMKTIETKPESSVNIEAVPQAPALSIITNQIGRAEGIQKLLTSPIDEKVEVQDTTISPITASPRSASPTKSTDVVLQVAKAKWKFWKSKEKAEKTPNNSLSILSPSPDHQTHSLSTLGPAGSQDVLKQAPKKPSSPPPPPQSIKKQSISSLVPDIQKTNPTTPTEVYSEAPKLPDLPSPPVNPDILYAILKKASKQIKEFNMYLKFIKIQIHSMEKDGMYFAALEYYKKEKQRLSVQVQKYKTLRTYLESIETSGSPPEPVESPLDDLHSPPTEVITDETQLKREKHVLKKEISRIKHEISVDPNPNALNVHKSNLDSYYRRYAEIKHLLDQRQP